ncbi:MAG: family 10 glycosylhydrolase, partial [Clostridia bacterium]|nr:family 10 glycosylhydrolase [Clostridia bacterium]
LVLGAALTFALISLFSAQRNAERPEEEAPVTAEPGETATAEPRVVEEGDEMRGVYIASVSNINFPSKPGLSAEALRREADRIIDVCSDTGFDTVFLQVRPAGDALYASDLFPSSRYLVSREGDKAELDVLQYFTERGGELGLKIVAWINPYRVTSFKSDSKEDALSKLSENNPARLHPEWTLFYGGKLYYDPARPEVRRLICDGVEEICRRYPVAGVLYDDYFYPYPVDGEVIDDGASFEAYASAGQSVEEFRRASVNAVVKATYETVKSVNNELTFGVSPFGIWKNASTDPAGSPTRGLEAYNAIYCDALAWINGGYVDYISPQIYWKKGYQIADFAALTRWWSARVDGTPVKLIISHAAYRVEEFGGSQEIVSQIKYARQFMNAAGNIQYGYDVIAKNTMGLRAALKKEFADPYREPVVSLETEGVRFSRPANGSTTAASAQFVLCSSDPRYPVYDEYGKIGRTKSGLFSVLMPLSIGSNTLYLEQNGSVYRLQVNRKNAAGDVLGKAALSAALPDAESPCLVWEGNTLALSVTGPAGGEVTATVGGRDVSLKPTIHPGSSGLVREVYEGAFETDGLTPGDLGQIEYRWERDGQVLRLYGARVTLESADKALTATVTQDYSFLKRSPRTSFYEDYTNASAGMCDRVIGQRDGFYQLAFGGFIAAENVVVEEGAPAARRWTGAAFTVGEREEMRLTVGSAVPLDARVADGVFTIRLFQTEKAGEIKLPEGDLLFSKALSRKDGADVVIELTLHDAGNYYGFDYRYDGEDVVFSFALPQRLPEGDRPLEGKTVVVDAGHGGSDGGAIGLAHYNEKHLNLMV